jgi:hypothetical protein
MPLIGGNGKARTMPDTVGSGTRTREPQVTRAARYAVEALFFAGTLVVVYALWG